MIDEALKLALEALENMCNAQSNPDRRNFPTIHDYGKAKRACIAIKEALAQPPLPVQPSEEWPGQSNIESPHNACQHRGYCKQMKEQPAQEPFEYWNAVEGWVKIDEVREHFDSVGCGTIYKSAGEGREPLYTTPPERKVQRTWVGLTDEEIAQGNKESWVDRQAWESAVWWAEAKLKEKNT